MTRLVFDCAGSLIGGRHDDVNRDVRRNRWNNVTLTGTRFACRIVGRYHRLNVGRFTGALAVRGRFERGDTDERRERRHRCARVVRQLRFATQQLHIAYVPDHVHVARGPVQTTHDQGTSAEVEIGPELFQPFRAAILPRRRKAYPRCGPLFLCVCAVATSGFMRSRNSEHE